MNRIPFDKSFFKKQKKQKYPRNAFFSYQGENRSGKNFDFKDFRNSNSIHSKFIRASFYGTLFNKSTLKYCNFGGAQFESIEFVNCNFKGSGFLGAKFVNCLFQNCSFDKTNFKNASFTNCFVEGSKFKGAKNLPKDFLVQKIPKINDIELMDLLKQRYRSTSLNNIITEKNAVRLTYSYSNQEIIEGLDFLCSRGIKHIYFSHLTIFIKRAAELKS